VACDSVLYTSYDQNSVSETKEFSPSTVNSSRVELGSSKEKHHFLEAFHSYRNPEMFITG